LIKAADMLIARRADTRARADFATWDMMVKLNGASALPQEAQTFLQGYKALLREMPQDRAKEATIRLMYKAYYEEMGGTGTPPELPVHSTPQTTDNVTAFKRPPPPRPKPASGPATKSRLPVTLIFVCLIVVYVGIRYYWQ
jgi:hypothetical protein